MTNLPSRPLLASVLLSNPTNFCGNKQGCLITSLTHLMQGLIFWNHGQEKIYFPLTVSDLNSFSLSPFPFLEYLAQENQSSKWKTYLGGKREEIKNLCPS